MYMLLLAIIYLAFISLGLPDSLLGSAWPVMHQSLSASLSDAGIITMIISGCTILSSVFSEKLVAKLKTQWVVVISVFLTAIAMLGFSFATRFWHLIIWAIPYGLGAGAIDSSLNNFVACHYKSKHMSWLHCFWGVGAIASPLIMGYSIRLSGWQLGYRLVAYIQFGLTVIFLATIPMWKNKTVTTNNEESIPLGFKRLFKLKGVLPMFIGFFCYTAIEATCFLWASTYLVSVHGIQESSAASFSSLFYVGMAVGRLLSGFVSERLGDKKLIWLGYSIVLVGILMLIFNAGSEYMAIIGFLITGLGCGPIYPSTVHSSPEMYGKNYSQGIIGIQMGFAYVGTTFMPPLFGLIAEKHIGFFPFYLLIFFVLALIMDNLYFIKTANKKGLVTIEPED